MWGFISGFSIYSIGLYIYPYINTTMSLFPVVFNKFWNQEVWVSQLYSFSKLFVCLLFFIYNILYFISTYTFYSRFWNKVLVIILYKSCCLLFVNVSCHFLLWVDRNVKAVTGTDWGNAPSQAVLPSSSKLLLRLSFFSLHCFLKLMTALGQLLYRE